MRVLGEWMSPERVDSSSGLKDVVKLGWKLPSVPQLSAALRELKMTYTEGDTLYRVLLITQPKRHRHVLCESICINNRTDWRLRGWRRPVQHLSPAFDCDSALATARRDK